jgi:hypothetical protein
MECGGLPPLSVGSMIQYLRDPLQVSANSDGAVLWIADTWRSSLGQRRKASPSVLIFSRLQGPFERKDGVACA